MNHGEWAGAVALAAFFLAGCASSELKPVDIYPEDSCSLCRMAVSNQSFASEIITQEGEVYKFDDLGCLEIFRKKNPQLKIRAVFVSDYATAKWIPYDQSVIVKTSVATPMGSGKVAFADSRKASAFAKEHPPDELVENKEGCGDGCCSSSD